MQGAVSWTVLYLNAEAGKENESMHRKTAEIKTELGGANANWKRCSEAWCDVGAENSLAIFHDADSKLYHAEMELGAECVELVALLCELNFARKWCPFVKLSERVMDTDYIMNGTLVYRLVLHPACLIVMGVMVLYMKQTHFNSDVAVCIQCEDMHRSTSGMTSSSYVAFDTFIMQFEKDPVLHRTCCSFEIRFLNVFAFVPSALLFVVCREMCAAFVNKWTTSARLLRARSLEMFAVGKQVERSAVYYAEIDRHFRRI